MRESPEMYGILEALHEKGLLIPRHENNSYLKYSYMGSGDLISEKWNVKVYVSGSVVCNDNETLLSLLRGTFKAPDPSLKMIRVDDAGGGFPLLGVMIGVEAAGRIETDVVDVSFFRGELFKRKAYLQEIAKKGWGLIQKLGVSPRSHRVEICTGCVNNGLKALLKFQGFDVRGVKIEGVLQDELEGRFNRYVQEILGVDLAYDPKEMGSKSEIAWRFKQAEHWGLKYAPDQMKWK